MRSQLLLTPLLLYNVFCIGQSKHQDVYKSAYTWPADVKIIDDTATGLTFRHISIPTNNNTWRSNTAIQLTNANIIYKGIGNPIKVGGYGIDEANLVIKSNEMCSVQMNGLVGSIYSDISTLFNEDNFCKVFVGQQTNNDTTWIDSMAFRIVEIPQPKLVFSSFKNGNEIKLDKDYYLTYLIGQGHSHPNIEYYFNSLEYIFATNDTIISWHSCSRQCSIDSAKHQTLLYNKDTRKLHHRRNNRFPTELLKIMTEYDLKYGAKLYITNSHISSNIDHLNYTTEPISFSINISNYDSIPCYYEKKGNPHDAYVIRDGIIYEKYVPMKYFFKEKGEYYFYNANKTLLFKQKFN